MLTYADVCRVLTHARARQVSFSAHVDGIALAPAAASTRAGVQLERGWLGSTLRTKALGRDRLNRQYWWFDWPHGWLALEACPSKYRNISAEKIPAPTTSKSKPSRAKQPQPVFVPPDNEGKHHLLCADASAAAAAAAASSNSSKSKKRSSVSRDALGGAAQSTGAWEEDDAQAACGDAAERKSDESNKKAMMWDWNTKQQQQVAELASAVMGARQAQAHVC
jgi:hypothetical protein